MPALAALSSASISASSCSRSSTACLAQYCGPHRIDGGGARRRRRVARTTSSATRKNGPSSEADARTRARAARRRRRAAIGPTVSARNSAPHTISDRLEIGPRLRRRRRPSARRGAGRCARGRSAISRSQVTDGDGGVGEPDALLELLVVQAAGQRVLAQEGDHALALGVGGAELRVGALQRHAGQFGRSRARLQAQRRRSLANPTSRADICTPGRLTPRPHPGLSCLGSVSPGERCHREARFDGLRARRPAAAPRRRRPQPIRRSTSSASPSPSSAPRWPRASSRASRRRAPTSTGSPRPTRAVPGLNAVRVLNPRALSDASLLDLERATGHVRGPLHGVPVLVKDNLDVAGLPTTAGNVALQNSIPRARLDRRGQAARGRRRDPRQDEPDRVRELHDQRHAERLLVARRPGAQPVRHRPRHRAAPRPAPAPRPPPASRRSRSAPRPRARSSAPAAQQGLVGLRPTVGLVSRGPASCRSRPRRTRRAR